MSSNLSKTIKNVLASDNEISNELDVREATASHQKEFPYDRDEEGQVTRREFCNFLFLTSSALFLGAAGFAGKAVYDAGIEKSFTPLKIEGANALQPGSALNFRYPNEKETAILIRAKDGKLYAYGQKCTHLSCPVYYSKDHDRLECPCHDGGFDVHDGRNLYGPPPRPLDKIEIEERGGEIWAVNRKERGNEKS
ncbi:MAG TPA: Rieske 2Fe-2S domain-containing protein [Pyrinomonadaceae bacterium]|nr:Rieske 2Fe-2S domain-containing protein [Pyrinomonadaceae bacterium]